MNAISCALAKRDRERMEIRREAGAESGTDWATTLLFNCLHDKYGFGRNRFAAMNCVNTDSTGSSMSVWPKECKR